jgi:predicted CXXCH cytochrome family protein
MLKTSRAHTCFGCHKEAVITMGVFQPVNYLTLGKTCVSCHPAHGGSRPHQIARMTVGMAVTCIVCHPTGDLHRVGF